MFLIHVSRVNRSKNLLVSQNLQKVGWNNFHNLIYQNTMKLFRTWRACQSQMKSSHCTEDRASERRASLITCCRCAVLSLLGSQLQSPVTPAGYFIADNERLLPQTHLNTSTFFYLQFLIQQVPVQGVVFWRKPPFLCDFRTVWSLLVMQ